MDETGKAESDRIAAVMETLERYPTAELLVECARLQASSLDENQLPRLRAAISGAFAVGKIRSNLDMLEIVDNQRNLIGQQIYQLLDASRTMEENDPRGSAANKHEAVRLSGRQEILFHHFVIGVRQIRLLLPELTRAAGFEPPRADIDMLESYTPLRHYFEHIDNRLPGKSNAREAVKELLGENNWNIQINLSVDDDGRIDVGGKKVDVTTRGLQAIQIAVLMNWKKAREMAMEGLRAFLLAHPESVPNPDELVPVPLVSVDVDLSPDET